MYYDYYERRTEINDFQVLRILMGKRRREGIYNLSKFKGRCWNELCNCCVIGGIFFCDEKR